MQIQIRKRRTGTEVNRDMDRKRERAIDDNCLQLSETESEVEDE